MDSNALTIQWRLASMLAQSSFLPEKLRQKPYDLFVVIGIARSLHMDPIWTAQTIYEVKGKIGFEGKYWIALANQRGVFDGVIDWEEELLSTDPYDILVTAKARLKGGHAIKQEISLSQAKKNGWTTDNNGRTKSAWLNPSLKLRWTTAVWLIRLYAPHVMMGFYATEELEDIRFAEVENVSDTASRLNTLVEEKARTRIRESRSRKSKA